MTNIIKDYPMLYKKDKNGKTRFWKLDAILDNNKYFIKMSYGCLNGGIITDRKEISKGKNIGKKNETTVEQQLLLVCDKTFKDKKEKEEYSEDIENIKQYKTYPPMLADKWDPNSKTRRKVDIIFPCYIQPKLDGIRCLTYLKDGKIVNQSRQLKYFKNLDHINNDLEILFKKYPNLVLDGELYNHDIVFNQIAGIVKKEKLKDEDKEKLTNIQYHVYDCFFDGLEEPFEKRTKFISSNLKNANKYVYNVATYLCKSKEEIIDHFHPFLIENKYEGCILRNKDAFYEFNRTRNLQKFKTFEDDEFEIVSYKEGTGHDAGTVIWRCKAKNGKEFDVRPKGTVEERSLFLTDGDKYIGKMLTVTYQELSEFGVPRFPVGKTIRDYE